MVEIASASDPFVGPKIGLITRGHINAIYPEVGVATLDLLER
jgi:hypothetical protein